MDWIPALLKHLSIAKSGVVAAFVTTLVLFFGHRLVPTYVDAVPHPWPIVVLAVLVFTGTLLVSWVALALWASLRGAAVSAAQARRARSLTPDELKLIDMLGKNPRESVDLDRLDYQRLPWSKLRLLDLVHSLESKGLVEVNEYMTNLFQLSADGRRRALDLEVVNQSSSSVSRGKG